MSASRWTDFFGLQGAQAEAAAVRGRDVIVSAGAGSGKTRTLVARYLSLLDEGGAPRGLTAVTFTEKAAREMRNRVREDIHRWRISDCPPDERARWEALEAEIDAARIGTIHSLCAAILRAHPAEAGIDPRFDVLDEGLSAAYRAQSVTAALEWAVGRADLQPLFEAFEIRNVESIVAGLLANQFDADAAFAGAGSGAWQAEALRALARFTRAEAARSAVEDLRATSPAALLKAAGDKLAANIAALLAAWAEAESAEARGDAVGMAAAFFRIRRQYCAANVGKAGAAKDAVRAIRDSYDEELSPWLGGAKSGDEPPDPAADARAAELAGLFRLVYERAALLYTQAKDSRQALDFDDLEGRTAQLLTRPDIRGRWSRQIEALMVDEFQDTNERQRGIVEALAGTADGRLGRLFAVGDAKQSIYRFRGAEVSVFRGLSRDIVDRGGLALALDRTYRAHRPLVATVNEIMRTVMGVGEDRPLFDVPFAPLVAERETAEPGFAAPHLEFCVGLGARAGEGRPAAARLLARRLADLHAAGLNWDGMALLFRASTGFPAYEAAFEEAGIPFVTVAGRGFYDRPEIRDVLNILRALAEPWDDLALAGALRSPAFGLSDAALYLLRWPDGPAKPPRSFWAGLHGGLEALPAEERWPAQRAAGILDGLRAQVDRVPAGVLLKELLDATRYRAALATHPHGPRLLRNLDKLQADAHAGGQVVLAEFLDYLTTLHEAGAREGEAPAEAGGSVRLMTVHKSKGLEFPLVVLADAGYAGSRAGADFLLSSRLGLCLKPDRPETKPLAYRLAVRAEAAEGEAELKRLLYVALTRAREKVLISGHYSGRDAGWLAVLAKACKLDLETLSNETGQAQTLTLDCGETVSALAEAEVELPVLPRERAAEPVSPLAPLYRVVETPTQDEEDETPARPRRVTGRAGWGEGALAGTLVHAALRRWCFPGAPAFEPLMAVELKSLGLIDPARAGALRGRAVELLERLRADPRWADLDAAEARGDARHEVPYYWPGGARPAGAIDLLYRDLDGAWRLVDFKTDAFHNPADLQAVLTRYRNQVLGYRAAAAGLLRLPVGGELCLLDHEGRVDWLTVN